MKRFDVVVIGAGMGGLCAAARLVKKGYRTLVLEKYDRLGGRCSNRDVEGFKVSTGAVLSATNSTVSETFAEVGAEFDLKKIISPCIWRIEGKDYEWPHVEGLANVMVTYGHDKEGAERVITQMFRAAQWQIPVGDISLRDWILQFTKDERIVDSFAPMLQGWLCLNAHEMPVYDFFRFAKQNFSNPWEIVYPPYGNEQSVMMPLAKVIQDNGGEIWKRSEVKKILVDNYEAKGVFVDTPDGRQEVSAPVVVSDIGPKKTVEYTGAENFDKAYLKAVDTVRPVQFFMDICVVSDEPFTEYEGSVMTVGARRICAIISPTVACPDLAPRGKHLLSAYATLDISKPVKGPVDVEKEKKAAVEELEELYPSVKKGRVLEIGCFEGDWPVFRAVPGTELPQKTSITNLYNVGDGVRIAEYTGTCMCAATAKVVVDDIAARIEPSK